MMSSLLIFIILIIMTAFFVATEFAVVKVRTSRIDQLVNEGVKGSKSAKHVISHLDEYLSACQLGITVTALGIGMVGESTFEYLLHPIFEWLNIPAHYITPITLVMAFVIATFLHVVIGELAPKTIALQKAEKVTLLFSKPIMLFYKLLYPFIWVLNGSARLLVGLFGLKMENSHGNDVHSEEEIKILLEQSHDNGEINDAELSLVNNVFIFDNVIARDIMVPRNDMVTISADISATEFLNLVAEENYTRYPVYKKEKDAIIGYVNVKDVLISFHNKREFNLDAVLKPITHLIDSLSVSKILEKMQKEQSQIIILVDEFGGTQGLLTMEDILEEIVGEIKDEFDDEEERFIPTKNSNEFIVKGNMSIHNLETYFNIQVDFDDTIDISSLGGLLMHYGVDKLDLDTVSIEVIEKENMIIKMVKVTLKEYTNENNALIEHAKVG